MYRDASVTLLWESDFLIGGQPDERAIRMMSDLNIDENSGYGVDDAEFLYIQSWAAEELLGLVHTYHIRPATPTELLYACWQFDRTQPDDKFKLDELLGNDFCPGDVDMNVYVGLGGNVLMYHLFFRGDGPSYYFTIQR